MLQVLFQRTRVVLLVGTTILFAVSAVGSKQFVMPSAQPANTYPAHEEHTDEGVIVAFDPYDSGAKANIFSVRYSDVGLLPIFLIITNNGDQPISLAGMSAEFVTDSRTKIAPASNDDIYRRLARPSAATTPSPLPWPKKVKPSVSKQAQQEIQSAQFAARAVEPHSTQAGFMFFDVSGISAPLSGAHIYLSGLHDGNGHELFYFDIPMEKYSGAPALK